MFKNEKYELGAPMTGYLLSTVMLLFVGLMFINEVNGIFGNIDYSVFALLMGVLILIIGFLCLKNSYFLDGISFILQAIVAICMGFEHMNPDAAYIGDIVQIVMAVAFVLVAYMAYMANDDKVAVANVLWAAVLILSLSFFIGFGNGMMIACGIVAIILAAVEAHMCYSDWKMIQEMTAGYESRLALRKKSQ